MSRVFRPGARGKEWLRAIQEGRTQYTTVLAAVLPDKALKQAARKCIQDNKDVFANCFCDFFVATAKGKAIQPVDPLPDVMMEIDYGSERKDWPPTAMVSTGSSKKKNKKLWCNYGTTSVLQVPNPKALLVPIVYGLNDGFTARWLAEDSKGVLKLCVSQEFKKEYQMQAWVVWHCKQHNVPEPPTTPFAPFETLSAMAEEGKQRAAAAFQDVCKKTRNLSYEDLNQTLENVPDLAARLIKLGDERLADCVAVMATAEQHMRALAAALKLCEYKYSTDKHDALLLDVFAYEPRPMQWFKRNDPLAHQALAEPITVLKARELAVELKQSKKCTVGIIRLLERFPGDPTRIVDELKRSHPDEHKAYMATLCAALADRTVEELNDASPAMRVSIVHRVLRTSDNDTIAEFVSALGRSGTDLATSILSQLKKMQTFNALEAESKAVPIDGAIKELADQLIAAMQSDPDSAARALCSVSVDKRVQMLEYLVILRSISDTMDAKVITQCILMLGLSEDASRSHGVRPEVLVARAETFLDAKEKKRDTAPMAAAAAAEEKKEDDAAFDSALNDPAFVSSLIKEGEAFFAGELPSTTAKGDKVYGVRRRTETDLAAGELNDSEVKALQALQLDEPVFVDEPESGDETVPGDEENYYKAIFEGMAVLGIAPSRKAAELLTADSGEPLMTILKDRYAELKAADATTEGTLVVTNKTGEDLVKGDRVVVVGRDAVKKQQKDEDFCAFLTQYPKDRADELGADDVSTSAAQPMKEAGAGAGAGRS